MTTPYNQGVFLSWHPCSQKIEEVTILIHVVWQTIQGLTRRRIWLGSRGTSRASSKHITPSKVYKLLLGCSHLITAAEQNEGGSPVGEED